MPTPKESAQAMIRSLPDDATYEDMQYKLYVLEQIALGEQSLEQEGGLTDAEARKRLGKWLAN